MENEQIKSTEKIKHLEFSQGIINRMAQNSFLIKGWTVTLISALFALAAKDKDKTFLIIAYFPTLMFWILDSYYLYQERLFRKVYDDIRKNDSRELFSLSPKELDRGFADWSGTFFSKTIILFYGSIIATLITVMFVINFN